MKILSIVAALALAGALVYADVPKTEDANLVSVVNSGKIATKTLLETLQKNMQQHMKKGGVMDALNFCSTEAYALTDKVNSELQKGVTTKRISIKYRNPANEPQADELKVLNSFAEIKTAKKALPEYVVEKVDEHTYKFYKPLTINNQVCLKCHGDISGDKVLEKAINERYPTDKAVNYKMDDLRGAVVVTIKK
ncbi:MAG: DUF3365 domain-containing protein [Thiovulaceae bacterium]|nr:DUF3365 domain-containing protein [Sulfurimonadaceae bacterium]